METISGAFKSVCVGTFRNLVPGLRPAASNHPRALSLDSWLRPQAFQTLGGKKSNTPSRRHPGAGMGLLLLFVPGSVGRPPLEHFSQVAETAETATDVPGAFRMSVFQAVVSHG